MKKIIAVILAVIFAVIICSPAMAGGHNYYRGGGHNNYRHGYYNSGRYYGEAIGIGVALGIAGAVVGSMVVPSRQCWEEMRDMPAYDRYGRFIGYVPQRVTVCQ